MHNLTIRKDNKVEFAYIGNPGWHGLGNKVPENSPLETWIEEAGMNWEIFETPVLFKTLPVFTNLTTREFPQRKVLFRSDTLAPLSIVSNRFHVVQPKEIIEFFRDLIALHGMKLSTAGTLFGGTKFWALGEFAEEGPVSKNDTYKSFVLIITGTDGTMSTTVKFVSTRVVCNNTANVALAEDSREHKTSHRKLFDPNKIKIDMELVAESWSTFMQNLKKMSEREMTSSEVIKFFEKTCFDPKAEEQEKAALRQVDDLLNVYRYGQGAEFCHGTALGVFNTFTNYFTHGLGKKNESRQFMNSFFGEGSKIKDQAFSELLMLC